MSGACHRGPEALGFGDTCYLIPGAQETLTSPLSADTIPQDQSQQLGKFTEDTSGTPLTALKGGANE